MAALSSQNSKHGNENIHSELMERNLLALLLLPPALASSLPPCFPEMTNLSASGSTHSVDGAWPVVTAALSPPAVPRAPAITHGEDKEAKNRTDQTVREKKRKGEKKPLVSRCLWA
jgi:hypothetical protein